MSKNAPNQLELATYAAEVILDSVRTYLDLAATLPGFVTRPASPQDAEELASLRELGALVGRELALVARIIDEQRIRGHGFDPAHDPRDCLPLVRAVGESMTLLGGVRSRNELRMTPLIDPRMVRSALRSKSINDFLRNSRPQR